MSFREYLDEGKKLTIDIDYAIDDDNEKKAKAIAKKYKIKVKETGATTADATGTQENLLAYMKAAGYVDLEELYPELYK